MIPYIRRAIVEKNKTNNIFPDTSGQILVRILILGQFQSQLDSKKCTSAEPQEEAVLFHSGPRTCYLKICLNIFLITHKHVNVLFLWKS